MRGFLPGVWVAVLGCGPVVAVQGDGTTGDGSGEAGTTSSGTPQPATTTPPPLPPTSSSTSAPATGGTTGSGSGSSSDTEVDSWGCESGGFICPSDAPPSGFECSPWEQDCPAGEKCMPWANDGGTAWNATRCSPIHPDPDAVGEPCTVEGSAVSGVDTCELGALCWDVDPETLAGTCIAMCIGSELEPTCADPCASCSIASGGALTRCVPDCDPIAQDCGDAEACYAVPANDRFECYPLGGDLGPGETCEYLNSCAIGLQCIAGAAVPGCGGAVCCSPFCTIGDPSGCDALPGTTCQPIPDLEAEPGCIGAAVGVCQVP